MGLLRRGNHAEALEMAKRLSEAVAEERLREFYEPYSGEGLGAREFGWSSLIAELADPDPAAPSTYLLSPQGAGTVKAERDVVTPALQTNLPTLAFFALTRIP